MSNWLEVGEQTGYNPSYIDNKWTLLEQLEYIKNYLKTHVTEFDGINLSKEITSITYDTEDGAMIESTGELEQGETTKSILVKLLLPFIASDDIVIDESEDGKHIEIHLDGEIISKLANSLQVPQSAPLSDVLVGIGTNKAQKNITIGQGLVIENNVLKTTGSGGSLYLHKLQLKTSNFSTMITLNVYTTFNYEISSSYITANSNLFNDMPALVVDMTDGSGVCKFGVATGMVSVSGVLRKSSVSPEIASPIFKSFNITNLTITDTVTGV